MDITFSCNKCGQRIAIDEAGAGQLVDCPKCRTPLEVPCKSTSTPAPALAPSPDRKCPYCAEIIKAEARVCRFCGYDIVTGKPPTRPAEVTAHKATTSVPKILAVMVIVIALAIGVFGYNFWKTQQNAKAETAQTRTESPPLVARTTGTVPPSAEKEASVIVESPFFAAAKEALEEAHKMQSAVGIGLTFEKYADLMIGLAFKVDNLWRTVKDTGVGKQNFAASFFCVQLKIAVQEYQYARNAWETEREFVLKYPSLPHPGKPYERMRIKEWIKAGEAVKEASNLYQRLCASPQQSRHPDDSESWRRLGSACRDLKLFNEAADAYEQAVKLKPDNTWALFGRNSAYLETGRTNEIIAICQQAINRKANDAAAWLSLAQVYLILKSDNATSTLEKAASLNPDDSWVWWALGGVYEESGRTAEAIQFYEKAAKLAPKDSYHWQRLGAAYVKSDRINEAITAYEHVVKLEPNYSSAWEDLAKAYRMAGRKDEAIKAFAEERRVRDKEFEE